MFHHGPSGTGFSDTGTRRLCKVMVISVFCPGSMIAEIGIANFRSRPQS